MDIHIANQQHLLDLGLKSTDGFILSYFAQIHRDEWFVCTAEKLLTDYPVFNVRPTAITDRFRDYKKKGIFEMTDDVYIAKRIVTNKTPQMVDHGVECEWCGGTALNLSDHHFPIPRKKGGTEMVRLCPSCHFDFHFVMDRGIIRFKDYTKFA